MPRSASARARLRTAAGASPREQQAASPRLAVVTERDGLRERFLGPGQVATTDPDVHQFGVAPRGAVAVHRP